jgi:hypothetical protein
MHQHHSASAYEPNINSTKRAPIHQSVLYGSTKYGVFGRSVCSPFTVTKAAESLKAFRSANARQHVKKVAAITRTIN